MAFNNIKTMFPCICKYTQKLVFVAILVICAKTTFSVANRQKNWRHFLRSLPVNFCHPDTKSDWFLPAPQYSQATRFPGRQLRRWSWGSQEELHTRRSQAACTVSPVLSSPSNFSTPDNNIEGQKIIIGDLVKSSTKVDGPSLIFDLIQEASNNFRHSVQLNGELG